MEDSSHDSVDSVADEAYELGAQVDSFVDERPLTALAIAMVVGALFARYIFSSRQSNDDFDHSPSGISDRANEVLQDLRRRIAH